MRPLLTARRPHLRRRRPATSGLRTVLTATAGLGAASFVLAACGTTSSPAAAPATTGAVAAAPVVKLASATVSGTSEQVLTNASGLTLYYFAPDTPTTSKCTGSCAGYWPPLLLPSGQPTASGAVSGSLTTVTDANGRQVEYNGHLLYRYTADTAPGQAAGNGKVLNGGTWYVATPSLAAGSGASASPSSSGFGY